MDSEILDEDAFFFLGDSASELLLFDFLPWPFLRRSEVFFFILENPRNKRSTILTHNVRDKK